MWVLYFIYKKPYIYIESFDIVFLLFLMWGGATAFWASDIESTIRLFLGSILVFFCYQIVKSYLLSTRINSINLEHSFYYASMVFVALSLLMYTVGFYKISGSYGSYGSYEHARIWGVYVERGMPRLTGPLLDPNIFSFYICFVFFYTLLKPKKRLPDYTFFLLLCISLFLCLSRGGWLAIFLATAVAFLFKSFTVFIRLKLRRPNWFFVFFIIVAILTSTYIILNSTDFLTFLNKRISSSSAGSGRFEICRNALELWNQNKLLGVGWFNFLHLNTFIYGRANYAHNTFIETLVETGLVGFLLYSLFHILILLKVLNLIRLNKRYQFILYAYLAVLIQFNSLSLVVNEVFFMGLILISVFYRNESRHIRF